jgi:hypothetical protein
MVFEWPEDIAKRLRSDFGTSVISAQQLLAEAVGKHEHLNSNRVLRCIIFLAQGDLDQLRTFLEKAIADPRDVILWAEYVEVDDILKQTRDFNKSFDESNLA